jgi:hypothetical protein
LRPFETRFFHSGGRLAKIDLLGADMPTSISDPSLLVRQLGDGLVLRKATSADAEALATFNARVHSDDGPQRPDLRVGAWVRDLLEKPHPTFKPADFTIVEDSSSGAIVSSMNLISQTWTYAGIPFGVGRPELVGTLPEYRDRGLVRAQFDVIHKWSADRGEKVQAITGIPYYYRQFGYEMGVNLGGGRMGYLPQVPQLKEGQQEAYKIRPPSEMDLIFIQHLYQEASSRYLVDCLRDESAWRYELFGKSEENVNRLVFRLIESDDSERVGFLAHNVSNSMNALFARLYELTPGISWSQVSPSVIRYLYATGKANAVRDGKEEQFGAFGFSLGEKHPAYATLHDSLPRLRRPYAWYLRIADLPDFLRHIVPVLEARMSSSAFSGHSGVLRITFYRSGLELVMEKGRLAKIEPWEPTPSGHSGDVAFPNLTFLQLLFGYRSLEELNYAFADCWWENDESFGLVNALFPKQASHIWGLS